MKNIKSICAVGLMTAAMAITSCTDLTEEPFHVLTKDNYYTDKASVEAAVLRPYDHASWCAWDGDRWLLNELTADHFVWTQKGRHGGDDGVWVRLHGHTWNYDQGQINGSWTGPFQGIAQLNTVLRDFKTLDFQSMGITDAEKANYISELRALRVWYYCTLIDFFRHVPLVTEENASEEIVGQSTPEALYEFMEKEIKEVLPLLKVGQTIGRITQAPAAAIMARMYFNSNVWISVDRSADCKKICEDIIANKYGTYAINQTDYRDPFRAGINGYVSAENVYEFPHKRNVYDFGGLWGSFMHYKCRYTLGNPDGANNGVHMQPSRDIDGNVYTFPSGLGNPYEKYADCDYRKIPFHTTSPKGDYEGFFLIGQQNEFNSAAGFGTTDVPVTGSEEYTSKPLVYVDQVGRFSEGMAIAKEKGSHVQTGEENSGVRLNKFPYLPDINGMFKSQSAPEIRLSEIYYMLAEIVYRAGDKSKAAELLDVVRKRNYPAAEWSKYSYVANPAKLTDQEFVDEWGREFIGEHRRRMDLIRWGRFTTSEWWDKKPDPNDKDYEVFPIPKRQLDTNQLLKQTTKGW